MIDKELLKKAGKKVQGIIPFHLRYLLLFRKSKGHWPHLITPRDYSDFVFRDNFYGNHNKHAFLADKLEVRKFVEEKGLKSILTNLYGYWDDASKIDFNTLPHQFAIKCNHSSGMNIIVKEKDELNEDKARRQLDQWMHQKHPVFYERHYFEIKPMILCEELIPYDANGFLPMDYKIHCANGKPIFIQCCLQRTLNSGGKRLVYNKDWQKLPYTNNDYHYTDIDLPKPANLQEMLDISEVLSSGLDYARIDLYDTDKGRVIFGEITLTPMGGWLTSFTQEALDVMGNEIKGNRH